MNHSSLEILLVEDNDDDAEITIRALKKNNLTNITHLKDGVKALEFLFGMGEYLGRNIEDQPELILLNLKMPKVDGIEVLKRIKASEVTNHIPVVVLASSKESPEIAICQNLGVTSYLEKSVDFLSFMNDVSQMGISRTALIEQPQKKVCSSDVRKVNIGAEIKAAGKKADNSKYIPTNYGNNA